MTAALPFTRPPHRLLVEPIVRHALEEDLGRAGDITSELTVPAERRLLAALVARKPGTIAGLIAAECAFALVDPTLRVTVEIPDGSKAGAGARLAVIEGPAREHPHRRTCRAEFRRPPLRRRHGNARAGRGGRGDEGAHRGDAQDDAGPAAAREIRGALRRRVQSPLRSRRRGADQGQPYRRRRRHRARNRARRARASVTW